MSGAEGDMPEGPDGPPAPSLPPEFDGYRIERMLGSGAMGCIYLARDTLLDRPVAIKVLSTASMDDESRSRFQVEARAVARLQHPCVVTVHRVGSVAGQPYLVTEYVEGETLDQVARPLDGLQILEIAHDLASGLAVAHAAGVVHRDVKPANVIRTPEGRVKLLDFGIARLVDPSQRPLAPVEAPGNRPVVRPSGDDLATGRMPFKDGRAAAAAQDTGVDPRITRSGLVLGTPAYMAPEVWCAQEATAASDVYSLGALLYELATGRPPHGNASTEELGLLVLDRDVVPLASAAPGIDASLAAVIDRCLARKPPDRWKNGEEVRAALARIRIARADSLLASGNPYRGLRAFDAEHAACFFGRETEIRAVLDRLVLDRVVFVAGDSGVGKSSLCRAGILPRIPGVLGADRTWSVAAFIPGRNPIGALCAGLAAAGGVPAHTLAQALADGPDALGRAVCAPLRNDRGVVLFVDQAEELATESDPSEAALTAEFLGWCARSVAPVRLLASVRADHLGRLADLSGLDEAVARSLYFLRPLGRERLREAVSGPAQTRGVTFESDALVDALVDSTARTDGGLPLLQFALERLWETRDEGTNVIPSSALDALGGVGGALSMHADQVVARLAPDTRETARRVLVRMAGPGGVRRSLTRAEALALPGNPQTAIDSLIEGRIVMVRQTPDETFFELAHEALLAGWQTLSRWLAADAADRAARERVAAARLEWERLARPKEALWGRRQLAAIASLDIADLPAADREFLDASRRRTLRSARIAKLVALATLVLVGATWGLVRHLAARDLAEQVARLMDEGERWYGEARTALDGLAVLERVAFDRFDARDAPAGEEAWARVQGMRAWAADALGRSARAIEPALLMAPDSADVRGRFAGVLYERALLAERMDDPRGVHDMLARLPLYDRTGERTRLWSAPAWISVTTDPPEADLILERYQSDSDGRLAPVRIDAPDRGPISQRKLRPGSYRLSLSAPGRASVRMPFFLRRGGSQEITVSLPRKEDVPDGFEYVPQGRFEYGSSAPDDLRRGFLHAVPLHAAVTGAFLIRRNETTFAEWLAYLDALPPGRRDAALPGVGVGGFEGGMTLRTLPDGRRVLTFKPANREYTAIEGQPMEFPTRPVRATQDWLRFPVSGITAAQAEAYVAWLDSTGRVPGARLCTEMEWERAARGADTRNFPAGNVLSPEDANYDATYRKDPTAMGPDEIGSHPASRSPFGLDDMAGNVWEWTVSSVEPNGHAARGGSFYFDANTARVMNRETPEASFRDVSVGFRVCADAPELRRTCAIGQPGCAGSAQPVRQGDPQAP